MAFGGRRTPVRAATASLTRAEIDGLGARRAIDVREPSRATLRGRVEALGELLVSPLTGRPCVAYFSSIVGHRPDPDIAGGEHSPYHRVARAQPFLLRDESGVASVETERCVLGILPHPDDIQYRQITGATGPELERCEELLRSAGKFLFVQRKGLSGIRAIGREPRFFESVLAVGDEVVVSGWCVPAGASSPTPYRDQPELRLTMTATSQQPVLIATRG